MNEKILENLSELGLGQDNYDSLDEEKKIDVCIKLCNKLAETDISVKDFGDFVASFFGEDYNGRMAVVANNCISEKYKNFNEVKFAIRFNRYKSIIIMAIWVCVVALIARYRYMR
jgi:HKD family nuclease